MSVYHGTSCSELSECLSSLVAQTLPPDEVLIVQDGPIHDDLKHCVKRFAKQLPIRDLALAQNCGLGPALREGLLHCRTEFVARVDSDDRSVPDRMRIQNIFLEEHSEISVVGAYMREWHHRGKRAKAFIRSVPMDSASIAKTSRWRNPLNHPTVMFRKSDVLECGNYSDQPFFEDYLLWIKMIKMGKHLRNLPVVLVETLIDPGFFQRRAGFHYLLKEISLAKTLACEKIFSRSQVLLFLTLRLPLRLLPASPFQSVYRKFLRKPSTEL